MAEGKYVWLLSADDSLRSPHALERFVGVMERNPRVGYVFCKSRAVQAEEDVGIAEWTDLGNDDQIWDGLTFLKRLVQRNCIVMSGLMVRKECYDKLSLFVLDLPHATDWYLWCLFALHYDVAYLSEPMASFRIHEQSLTSAFNRGGSPVCLLDELNVLWRVARETESVRGVSIRAECNASIATFIAATMESNPMRAARPGLSEAEFDELVVHNARDPQDEKDVRYRVHIAIGDERFWNGRYREAAEAYQLALRLHPYSLRVWVKYLLGKTGRLGIAARRLLTRLAPAAKTKPSIPPVNAPDLTSARGKTSSRAT